MRPNHCLQAPQTPLMWFVAPPCWCARAVLQGPFYCGVGAESVFGRPLAESHMEACLEAGLTISGINAEVRTAAGGTG